MVREVPTITRLGKDYQVIRHAEGTWNAGKYVSAVSQTFTIRAVITPANPQTLQMLPQGEREKDVIRIFTATELHTSDPDANQEADHIQYNGRDYRVVKDSDWTGRFYECVAVRD